MKCEVAFGQYFAKVLKFLMPNKEKKSVVQESNLKQVFLLVFYGIPYHLDSYILLKYVNIPQSSLIIILKIIK